jgi:Succinylglutamate desuccinylase / Aspartoacylase family
VTSAYPIAVPGVPWGPSEVEAWQRTQRVQRSYSLDVEARVRALAAGFDVLRYGELEYGQARYALWALRSRSWIDGRPSVLVTGGVHGYETSGVAGALQFLEREAAAYLERVNLLVAPCVSPWAYERIHRWNANAIDPNRSFRTPSPARESGALMELVHSLSFDVHIDLHETTDTDETEFRPALAARDGKSSEPGTIPDGFYVVADAANPRLDFQSAIIEAVSRVTHIAPADASGEIIGSKVVAEGVIEYEFRALGLCAGMTSAALTTTTEVYPDSPRATPEECNAAQVAAVCAAIEFALNH